MVKFVQSEALPLVNEFNEETAPKIFGGEINQHILLFVAKSDDNYDAIREGFATAAKDHKDWVQCSLSKTKNAILARFFEIPTKSM